MSSDLHVWLPSIRAGSGADVFVERLAASLTRAGVRTTVTWFKHRTELLPDVLRLHAIPSNVSVIHANTVLAFACRRSGIPLIATEHHYIFDPAYRPYKSFLQNVYHTLWQKRFFKKSYAVADAITTDSHFTAEVLRSVAGIAVTQTIPLWVDYSVFSPGAGGKIRTGENGLFRLLFVGNASRRKGADVILPLAERLGNQFEIRCTAGLRQSGTLEQATNVKVLGRLTEQQLVDEYRQCDAVLVPSRYEGFGYAALEAMACAKPVVGFRCGAIAEVVEEGRTALLVDVDDIEGLATRCRQLAADPSLCTALGEAGRQHAEQTYSEAAAIAAYVTLYEKLLSK
jgi:alpha-maltose-1-phosphate synthase